MKKFKNCSMEPANVSLMLTNASGKTTYEIYGFALKSIIDGVECIELQPADTRKKPVMVIPLRNVEKIVCKF